MADDIRMGGFQILPPVVKNLLIINVLFFVATIVFARLGVDLDTWLGLHYFSADNFHIWQPITYMFMHSNFGHLFFNMFALWMFGSAVENYWGAKRFLIFYFITGIGAGITHYAVLALTLQPDINLINAFVADPTFENFAAFYNDNHIPGMTVAFRDMLEQSYQHLSHFPSDTAVLNQLSDHLELLRSEYVNAHVIVGASGAVFGLLLAFGMLFPNSQIYLYFLIPIKAKWFVLIYGAIELFYGITGTADGIGHFAHLGAMLFGFILIMIWRHNNRRRQDTWYDEF
jgi:membrane associated rhomboid family serine protease